MLMVIEHSNEIYEFRSLYMKKQKQLNVIREED